MISTSKTLSNFERTSSIRHSSRRAKTLESISSLYMEEDVMKNLEESSRIERAFGHLFDLIVVNDNHDQTFRQVLQPYYPTNIGTTRATPMATPLVSDKVEIWVAVGCSQGWFFSHYFGTCSCIRGNPSILVG